MATSGLTAALTLVLVRVLHPHGYGIFALAVSIGGMLFLLADLGITNATTRFVAEAGEDREAVRALVLDGWRLKALSGGLVCGTLALLAGPIAAAYHEPGLAWPLRLVAVAVFGQALMSLPGAAATALGRSDINLRIVVGESVIELGASLGLVLAGGGAAGAAGGRAIGYLTEVVIGSVLVLRLLGRTPIRRPRGTLRPFARRIAGYAGALLLVDGALAAFNQIDVLLVGGFLGAGAAGAFQAPLRLLTFLHYPGYSVAMAVAPRYGRRADAGFDTRLLGEGLRGVILLQLALTVPTIVWARPLAGLLLGAGYGRSGSVLAAFGPMTSCRDSVRWCR